MYSSERGIRHSQTSIPLENPNNESRKIMAIKLDSLVVDSDSIEKPRRGRKRVEVPQLGDALKMVTKTKSINATPLFGEIKSEERKNQVAGQIRQHWKAFRNENEKASITWNGDLKTGLTVHVSMR
jgi:tryptophanyl-tRNA synthetase